MTVRLKIVTENSLGIQKFLTCRLSSGEPANTVLVVYRHSDDQLSNVDPFTIVKPLAVV